MKRLATAFSLLALAAAPAAEAQFTNSASTTTNFTNTGTQERGIAYGVVGGNQRIYVTSRNAGTFAYIYDANTRAFQATAGNGTGSLNTTGITGGVVALQDIEVSDDGLIYGCNLSTSNVSGANVFKCYHWANEAAAPQAVTFTGIPAAAYRLGDKIRVTGSLATGLHMWVASPGTPAPDIGPQTLAASGFRCLASDAVTFACDALDISAFVSNSPTNVSVSPAPGSTTNVWINANGINPRLATIPASGSGIATQVNLIPGAQLNGTGNNSIYAFNNSAGDSSYVAIFEYTTTAPRYARARIVNVTGIETSTVCNTTTDGNGFTVKTGVCSWGITASASSVSASGLGDIAFRINPAVPAARRGEDGTQGAAKVAALPTVELFVLGPNGGFLSAETNKASLPVELVNFAGVANGSTARLSWGTVSETNNAGFFVEHLQGDTWADASGLIAGHGTTTEAHAYAFDVNGLAPGTHTFRLRQTDTDGSLHYSANVTVEIALENDYAVTLLGNRAVRVAVATPQAVTVRVYDVLGRAVATLRTGDLSGSEDLALPTNLAAGSYLVRVEGERFAATKNLVVR